jgi:ferredoxin
MDRGLCPKSIGEIKLLGEPASRFFVPDFKQPDSRSVRHSREGTRFARPLAAKLLTPRPAIRTASCVGCGKCAESCPQHTIEIKNKKAAIDYSKCIRCYCCHEMCPFKAIDIKRFKLLSI